MHLYIFIHVKEGFFLNLYYADLNKVNQRTSQYKILSRLRYMNTIECENRRDTLLQVATNRSLSHIKSKSFVQ